MVENIVLSSGGVNGLAILGYLHKHKTLLPSVQNYFGSSIGSIISVLLASRVSPFDIFIQSLRLKKFSWSTQLETIIADYIGQDTLGDLYNKTMTQVFITVYRMSDNKKLVYSHRTSPNVPVTLALKQSCNFLNIKSEFYDGVLVSPLPITLCKSIAPGKKTWAICTKSHQKTMMPFEFIRILLDTIQTLEMGNLSYDDKCTIINVDMNFLTVNLSPSERISLFLKYI